MAIELYPHNVQTYKKMTAMFEESNRVGIVQPTGTGKSFIVLRWIEDHPHEKFVVLSPSLEIFMQFVGYARETGDEALLDNVQMLSYQTLIKMSDKEISGTHAQKIVVDEFHRAGAFQWGPALLKLLDSNPYAKVLGTSATPVRYLDGLRDMASELFDRNLAVEMTVGEAVCKGILPMPKIVEILYDVEGMVSAAKMAVIQETNAEKRKEAEKVLDIIKRHLEQAEGVEIIFQKYMPHDHGKFIVFCRNKEHLEEMMKTVPKWLRLVNKKVRSYVSIADQADKDVQLWAFVGDNSRDSIKLLFTVDRLNEGLHVKGIDGVIMLRPTESPIIYLQQMGRALTAHNKTCNKSPTIFDMVNNYESVKVRMQNGEMRNVIEAQFLEAGGREADIPRMLIAGAVKDFNQLMHQLHDLLYPSYDATWTKMLALYVEYKTERREEPAANNVFKGMNLGYWCSTQRKAFKAGILSAERIERLQAAGFVFDVHCEAWEQMFACAQEYFQEHRNLEVPANFKAAAGVDLGRWISVQRVAYKKGNLSAERQERLKSIGMVWDVLDAAWERNFEAYNDYIQKFGTEPAQRTVYKGVRLGLWCFYQRKAFKNGTLSTEKIKRLQANGFVFDALDTAWEHKFKSYVRYKEINGSEPSSHTVYNGINLGGWCRFQKEAFRTGALSAQRIEQLRDAGFVFEIRNSGEVWERNFQIYVAYKKEFGKEPPHTIIYQGIKLGNWCRNQRVNFKKGILAVDKIERLLSMGFVFDVYCEAWENGFRAYVAYKKEFGEEPTSMVVYKGLNLGNWCSFQKQNYKANKLSDDKIQKLRDAGFPFNPRA